MRNRYFLLLDLILLAALPFLVVALRLESFTWTPELTQAVLVYAALALPIRLGVALASELYRFLWEHASLVEMERLVYAGVVSGVLTILTGAVFIKAFGLAPQRMPFSALILDAVLAMVVLVAPRLWVRFAHAGHRTRGSRGRRALIVGAGSLGQTVLREMALADLDIHPVGFVDDDAAKCDSILGGVPVLGRIDDLPRLISSHFISEVIIAIPAARGTVVRKIVHAAGAHGITARIVPGVGDLISGKVLAQALRHVEIEDLLRREPVHIDLAAVQQLAGSRCVLVTGAGGSIGSELCRQLSDMEPSLLVVVDHSENQVFDIQAELARRCPGVKVVAAIADVRNESRLRSIFERYAPFAVFHAAAHKHVPLMEENIVEAITNNILGTRTVVDAALDFDVQHFVFISTDKAVRPTSIMGASKRVAEKLVRHAAASSGRNFVAVRFGNVLGSRGSVIPSFLRQIREGGPITVTHPEMRRFFMTIPEAVQLVLQAAALGTGGELFFLDMGEPVRIVDLARDLLRLSGLEEGADIDIVYTGIRPGEKLYEELVLGHEDLSPTSHAKILRVRNDPVHPDAIERIHELLRAVASQPGDEDLLSQQLRSMVPDFSLVDPAAVASPATVSLRADRSPSGPRPRVV